MKQYELTYLITSELSEDEGRALSEKVTSFVQDEGGLLINSQIFIAKKQLAYPIKKQTQAHLVTLIFQLNPEKLAALEIRLKKEENILRYLIIMKKVRKALPKLRRRLTPSIEPVPGKEEGRIKKEKKVELKDIEKKLEEII